jgi:hypothetical protein
MEPAGCSDIIALNTEGKNNSITAILSVAAALCDTVLSLLKL